MDRERRAVIFGRDAHAYDAGRPGYPIEVVRHVLSRAAVGNAVEIGAGTGKATTMFALEIEHIVCVEPSAEMAAVLEAKGLPGVEVVVSSLDDWPGPEKPVDLVYAAQAWHWVDGATAYSRVREMLRPGGVIALIWNVPEDRYARFAEVYREHAPEILGEQDERIERRDSHTWKSDLVDAGYEAVELFSHGWSQTHSPERLRALYSTYSDHMMIPEPRRSRLLDALEDSVRQRGGGLTLSYQTNVYSGIRPPR